MQTHAPIEVLIAEDSPTQSEQLRHLLVQNGYRVRAAANGRLALEMLSDYLPQIIISDVVMPEMDGYALCRAVKQDMRLAGIPVMLVTSLADVHDVLKGLESGADHFIRKPYDEKYLLSHIDYLLKNRRAAREKGAKEAGIEIFLQGQRHFISVERQQILDLLISTYEEAMHMNAELAQQQQKLARSNQSLNGLYLIAEGLNHATSEQEVLEQAVARALELPGVEASWIWLREGERGFRLAAACEIEGLPATCSGEECDCRCQRALLDGELGGVIHIVECERLCEGSGAYGHAHVSIPLGPPENPMGILNLGGHLSGLFSDEELKIASGVGKQIDIALARGYLHDQLRLLIDQRTQALRSTEQKLEGIVSSMKDVVYSARAEPPYQLLVLNQAAVEVYGRPVQDFLENPGLWMDLVHPADRDYVMGGFDTLFQADSVDLEYRFIRGDADIRWVHHRINLVRDAGGQPLRFDGIVEDITQRKQQEAKILRLNRVYAVLSGINTAIVHINDRRQLFETSCRIATEAGGFRLAWIGVLDHEAGRITPVAWSGLGDGYLENLNIALRDDGPHGRGPAAMAMRQKRAVICNDIATAPQMAPWRDKALERDFLSMAVFPLMLEDKVDGVFALYASEMEFFDHDELKLLQELVGNIGYALENLERGFQLHYLASHDKLTGLPNRAMLQDRMRTAMAQADRGSVMMAILFIDLDRFKVINDSLGHGIGDILLQMTATRLTNCVYAEDTISRLGGDEFVVMLPTLRRTEDLASVAKKILDALAQLFEIETYELYLTASIGICIYPRDGEDEHALLKNAETAMYRAKEGGKNRFEFFTRAMNEVAMRRLELESQLQQALEREEFLVYYQPQGNLQSGQITGVEALIRWNHPKLGMVSPVDFIPILEETGLIIPIGEWIMETACRQARGWVEQGISLRMGVNLSARQFLQNDMVTTVARVLESTGLEPQLLKLELTESLFIESTENTINMLKALRTQGVRMAVDDFGTGYSSLSYLRRFPVTSVKIDQSFVTHVTTDPDAAALVRSIISMAHELRLMVIAEGVESVEQLEFLAQHQCDEIQGYLLGKPMPADECLAAIQLHAGLPGRLRA